MCWGSVHRNDLSGCFCTVEAECAREQAHRLSENPRVPAELKLALRAFAESPVPGRRPGRPLAFQKRPTSPASP